MAPSRDNVFADIRSYTVGKRRNFIRFGESSRCIEYDVSARSNRTPRVATQTMRQHRNGLGPALAERPPATTRPPL